MRQLLALAAAVSLSLASLACGGDDPPKTVTVTTPTVAAKPLPPAAKVTAAARAHLDRAVDALRTGIQVPYEQGQFDKSGMDVVLTYATAAQSAATAVRELQAALDAGQAAGGLGAIGDQVTTLLTDVTGLVGAVRDGGADPAAITKLLDDVDALGQTAEAAGVELPRSSDVTPGTTTTTP